MQVREQTGGKRGQELTGQTGQGDTGTSTRGLVHLAEHKGVLGLAVELDDTSLLHFVVQVVALTSALTDAGEDRVATVGLGNVVLQTSAESSSARILA